MCTLPPLPAIGPALPWDAPGVWAIWLGLVGFCGLVYWAIRVNRSYGRDPRSRAEWMLGWTAVTLFVAVFGAYLIVYFPADNALIRWRFIASSLPGCAIDVWHPVWAQQSQVLTTFSSALLVIEVVAFALWFVSGALGIRRRRRERAQVTPTHR